MNARPAWVFLVQVPPPVHGVTRMNEYLLTSDWLKRDYDVSVVPLQFAASVGDIGRFRLGKIGRLLATWRTLLGTCVRIRPQHAYFTIAPAGGAFWRDVTFVAILKALGVGIVYHLHGKGFRPSNMNSIRAKVYRWVFNGSKVIHLSYGLAAELNGLVDSDSVRIVPNGVPDLPSADTASTRDDAVNVLFLSNLLPEKGPFDLIEAIARLREEGLRIRGTFVGPFPSDEVHAQFERRCQDRRVVDVIRWAGPAFGEERYRHLREADIFAFPSYYGPEAFPLVVLEAMAAGLPVVAAATGAIPEMIDSGQTGLLVPPRDPQALARALKTLATDPSLRIRQGRAARAKYLAEYQIETFRDRMRTVFAEAAGLTIEPEAPSAVASREVRAG